MNVNLAVFPAPLLRLILRGGHGLTPAWGPLACPDWSTRAYVWNPMAYDVTFPRGMSQESGGPPRPLVAPESWFMPLDDDSPWPARLAMISTWLVDPSRVMPSCVRDNGDDTISLIAWDGSDILWEARWTMGGVVVEPTDRPGLNLPTLAQHLQAHPLIVALPLALYDVPEIRARVAP